MTIRLTPRAKALFRQMIERGDNPDPAAFVDEALQALAERDQHARLVAAIAAGDELYARGQVVTWTPDFLDRLKREAAEQVHAGTPVKDEVKP